MRVKVVIQARGQPLRRAYVEHIVAGVGTGMYMTELDGRVFDGELNEGIDSITAHADIRIICQNPLLRVLDGDRANIGVYQDKAIDDGDTVNLNINAEQDDYYAILNRAHATYEIAFRWLSFFSNLPDPDFPLGRKPSLRDTRDQPKRIDLIYPDHSVAPLAWVEPKRLGDDFPLMHIKAHSEDARLFGDDRHRPTLIPHEFAHALHFSMLSEARRARAQDKYAEFILASPISGVGPFHDFALRTTAEVAYIESAGWFSQNFVEFLRDRQGDGSVRPEPITPAIQSEFVQSEWVRLITYPGTVVAMIRYGNGVITAFSNKAVYFSPDGQNLGGGGNTIRVYDGRQTVVRMIPYGNDVITAFSGKGIYFSPDGRDVGGGGSTVRVYTGTQSVIAMMPYRNGVITAFSGNRIYFSPDGQNAGGGGSTVRVYDGDQNVVDMIPFRNGVMTAFSGKGIYFSPDGQNLGGGGNTVRVYDGNQSVVAMIPYRNGAITAFSGKRVYFSPDGQNVGLNSAVAGVGNTVRVYDGNQTVVAMIPYRAGVITAFSGKRIYFSPDGQNLGLNSAVAGVGNTIRVFDGAGTVAAMMPFRAGVIAAFSDNRIYFSLDGRELWRDRNIAQMPGPAVPRELVVPIVKGGDVEGAVYGAIFADFASFVGLDLAASAYFEANAITFGHYRSFIENQRSQHTAALEQVRSFWGL
ncbi:MAG: WD40 repeat domain-containing protein [Vicinamibacterales bacterium]